MTRPPYLLCLLLVPVFSFLAVAQDALNNDAVVKMVKSGLGENLIVSMIEGQPGKYSLSPDELIRLKEAGLSEKILSAMAAKGSGSPSRKTASGTVRIGLKTAVKLVVDQGVSSKTAKPGDTFKLTVAEEVVIDGHVVIAKGAAATGRITGLKKKSFAAGNASLSVTIDSVQSVDGRAVPLDGHIEIGGERAGFGNFGKEAEIPTGYAVNAVVASETEVKL